MNSCGPNPRMLLPVNLPSSPVYSQASNGSLDFLAKPFSHSSRLGGTSVAVAVALTTRQFRQVAKVALDSIQPAQQAVQLPHCPGFMERLSGNATSKAKPTHYAQAMDFCRQQIRPRRTARTTPQQEHDDHTRGNSLRTMQRHFLQRRLRQAAF